MAGGAGQGRDSEPLQEDCTPIIRQGSEDPPCQERHRLGVAAAHCTSHSHIKPTQSGCSPKDRQRTQLNGAIPPDGRGRACSPSCGQDQLPSRQGTLQNGGQDVNCRRPGPATVKETGYGEAAWLRGKIWAEGPRPGSTLYTTRMTSQGTCPSLGL